MRKNTIRLGYKSGRGIAKTRALFDILSLAWFPVAIPKGRHSELEFTVRIGDPPTGVLRWCHSENV